MVGGISPSYYYQRAADCPDTAVEEGVDVSGVTYSVGVAVGLGVGPDGVSCSWVRGGVSGASTLWCIYFIRRHLVSVFTYLLSV